MDEGTVVDQLRRAGEAPLDDSTRRRVLAAVSGRVAARHQRSVRLKVAAAALGGFLVGGTGLASAGALPAPAQDAAHHVFHAVGVSVPPGHDRYNDPAACPGGPYANHGAYVRAHKGDPAAGQSRCGKPVKAGQDAGTTPTSAAGEANGSNGRGGPPPWAGKGSNKDKGPKNGTGDDGADDAGEQAPAATTPTTKATAPAVPSTVPTTTTNAPTQATAPPETTTTVAPTTTTTVPSSTPTT